MNDQETLTEWGPLVGPWIRVGHNPLITLAGGEKTSIQNGPQAVFRRGGRWWMVIMANNPTHGQATKLAVSDDGLTWTRPSLEPVLRRKHPWEGGYAVAKVVCVVGDEVRLYYFGKKGIEERIGLATTRDMKTFRKHEGNPIFTAADSSMDGQRVFPNSVVEHEGKWYLYYDIGWGYKHAEHPRAYVIGAAVSADGVQFEDGPNNPLIELGPAGTWDAQHVCQASVVFIDPWWYMLYIGASETSVNKHGQSVGLARAANPLGPWEKYPANPVFAPSGQEGAWDGAYLQHPCPVEVDGQWRLYYTGNNGQVYAIGMAIASRHLA